MHGNQHGYMISKEAVEKRKCLVDDKVLLGVQLWLRGSQFYFKEGMLKAPMKLLRTPIMLVDLIAGVYQIQPPHNPT
ncbi:hypothetical protein C5167_037573 [Papaver somniferum]|uniref:Uncharacterized protein n=1 Tax=Papaver somniferum TaxID=3469 RepID=A0A4Y7I9X8_PAPSO|nr:hypothetical protein C5167_037573 [Papaver somniferum]